MAVLKNGANGSFSGKVGSIVGYEWKGISVIRGLPKKNKHRTPSPLELANRQKMALIQKFLQQALPFIRLGFSLEAEAGNMSAFNAAMSYNKKNAIAGEYPDLSIDFHQALLAKGTLSKPMDARTTLTKEGIQFEWNPHEWREKPFVRSMLFMTSFEYQSLSAMVLGGVNAKMGKEVLPFGCRFDTIPKQVKIHTFMAFVTAMHDAISDSVYCGAVEV